MSVFGSRVTKTEYRSFRVPTNAQIIARVKRYSHRGELARTDFKEAVMYNCLKAAAFIASNFSGIESSYSQFSRADIQTLCKHRRIPALKLLLKTVKQTVSNPDEKYGEWVGGLIQEIVSNDCYLTKEAVACLPDSTSEILNLQLRNALLQAEGKSGSTEVLILRSWMDSHL